MKEDETTNAAANLESRKYLIMVAHEKFPQKVSLFWFPLEHDVAGGTSHFSWRVKRNSLFIGVSINLKSMKRPTMDRHSVELDQIEEKYK
jgi:hypothetical protein